MRQKAGRITAAGMTKEVTFEPVDGINDRIDDAYRTNDTVMEQFPDSRLWSLTRGIVPVLALGYSDAAYRS